MRAALSIADVLLAPTTPFPPFPSAAPADPASLLLNDVLTVPISLTGVPAISIPVATTPLVRNATSAASVGRRRGRAGSSGGDGGVESGDENAEAMPDGELCRLPLGMQVKSRCRFPHTCLEYFECSSEYGVLLEPDTHQKHAASTK